jgi:plasmid stabilization system protein ParE
VRRFIQAAAEEDILHQIEWYAQQGVPAVARRFQASVLEAVDALSASPEAGTPKFIDNPRLAGLRSWPVKGFRAFRIYYLVQPEVLIVVRVLHGKRDVADILGNQEPESG